MTALCALVASASAPPTPFMIYGYVSYEDGSECDNPTVNINNTNTSNEWSTEIKTNASYNYYQLILANGSDVNASEILRFNVTSPTGNQSNITEHTVTQENITDGGLFNFNITLESPAAPTITNWYNNKTKNNSTEITINESECVFFNATADQAIDVWSWFVNGTNQSHNLDNFSYCGWTVNGTYYVNVNGTNANGTSNAITWTVTVNDTTPPEIVDHTPTGTNVPVTTNITATFSEAINPSTLNNETIVVENSTGSKIEGDITYTSETCTVTFDPVSNLEYNETYNVTITTGVQDLAGNNMSSNFTWNFTTRSEVMEATVAIGTATTSPGNTTIVPMMIYNATNVGVIDVNLTYNQSVVMVINVTGVDFENTIPNLEHNSSGFVRIGAWQMGNPPGLSGTVVIANIALKALGSIGQSSTLNISVNEFKEAMNVSIDIPYTVSNGTFNIINYAPVLDPIGSQSANEGTELNITITASDPDGDSLNFSSNASFGTFTMINSTATYWSWTPNYTDAGVYYVDFGVSDGELSDNETVEITVNNVNRAPVLDLIGSKTVDEGTELNITITASDPDGDGLLFSSNTSFGSFTPINSTATYWSWTPSYTDAGVYYVDFGVSDGELSDNETVEITVNDVNMPPVLEAIGDKTGNENETLTIDVNATDPDGDTLTYSCNRTDLFTFNTSTGVGSWTPDFDDAGAYYVDFGVSDSELSDNETVEITVHNVNRAPVANAGMDQVVLVNESVFFDGSGSYDPDGEGISYYWDFGDGSNGTGVTPTHNYTINGTYNVTLTVTDSNGATGNDTCNVTAYKNGDANGDGEVMLFDAMYLAKSVLGITGYEAIPITSDVCGDGEVTLFDAMYLAKHVLEITGFEDLK